MWSSVASNILMGSDWYYTSPIPVGAYFRISHSNPPGNSYYQIVQASWNSDNSVNLQSDQAITLSCSVTDRDVVRLVSPPWMDSTNPRRIGIRRIVPPPDLGTELRRLLLPQIFQSDVPPVFQSLIPSQWKVNIEVSDVADSEDPEIVAIKSELDIVEAEIVADKTELDQVENQVAAIGSSGNSSLTGKQLTYQSGGDTNGLFYWIGTNKGLQAFANPVAAGQIAITASSIYPGGAFTTANLADRQADIYATGSETNPWIQIDLMESRLILGSVALKGRGDANSGFPRSWTTSVGNDATNLAIVDTQTNNQSIVQGGWTNISIANQSQGYRYVRLTQQNNSENSGYFILDEIELYGTLL